MIKPYSESCEQNRDAIFDVIEPIFLAHSSVFEIGSGTGQHAVYFAEKMQHLKWHTSDCQPYLEGIQSWLSDSNLDNVISPVELDVSCSQWPEIKVDAVFTANSIHIMQQRDVVNFMTGVGKMLVAGGNLIIYGPFNYGGNYTSESNERFDRWLKQRDTKSGIKAFEEIEMLADENGMRLEKDYSMPANNHILHFVRQ